MARSKLTSKGQTTIPMLVRERLGLSAGDAMDFVFQPDGSVSLQAVKRSLRSLEGMLAKPGRPAVTLGEMDDTIRAHAVKRHARSRKTPARRRA
jgi:AbrB family looped-hinge helix DNA binding protein